MSLTLYFQFFFLMNSQHDKADSFDCAFFCVRLRQQSVFFFSFFLLSSFVGTDASCLSMTKQIHLIALSLCHAEGRKRLFFFFPLSALSVQMFRGLYPARRDQHDKAGLSTIAIVRQSNDLWLPSFYKLSAL